ncbi:four helix bundle protein [Gracilimonas mengyeensis]|uniref:Four helix bundle protein n=1 Tax=Gracilimonas mengyeensis TaxID=1302730 RepID=A0A521FGS9_9BACT|nr:four helix bundle protein [Gracilimonas mengyeensis]SMO94760.1 four helix bundle protein [Gracilimonas mengyeensis]
MNYKKFDLEERLIQFALNTLEVSEKLPKTYIGKHLSQQLVRCGTSPAFHYSEAKSAESRKDFVHKLKIGLKELRESSTNMKIIQRKPLLTDPILNKTLKECEELISIFVKSIQTTKGNMDKK